MQFGVVWLPAQSLVVDGDGSVGVSLALHRRGDTLKGTVVPGHWRWRAIGGGRVSAVGGQSLVRLNQDPPSWIEQAGEPRLALRSSPAR